MSVKDLLLDMARDEAGMREMFRCGPASEYAELNRRYQEAALAVGTMRNEEHLWKVRRIAAEKHLQDVVEEFELKGYLLP